MIDILRRNPLLAALAILVALLAVVIAVEVASGGLGAAPAPSARRVVPAEAKLLPPIVAAAPEQAYPEMGARPLWIATRRPAPEALAQAGSFARGQFVLQGSIIAGGTRIAMLREKSSGKVHRVEQGKDVNGVHVLEIAPEKVVLAQGGEREELQLMVQKPSGNVPGPGAFAPAAAVPGAAAQGPFGAPSRPAASSANPVAAARRATPGSEPGLARPMPAPSQSPANLPRGANPSAAPVPQQATTAPMTPEELLARRRARRTQTPQ